VTAPPRSDAEAGGVTVVDLERRRNYGA